MKKLFLLNLRSLLSLLILGFIYFNSIESSAQTTFSSTIDVQNVGNSWGLDIAQRGDTLIIYTGVYCLGLPCCLSTSLIMLDEQGNLINERYEDGLLPSAGNFSSTNERLYYLSQIRPKTTIGEPRTECISDSLILTSVQLNNFEVLEKQVVTFSDEFEYSIQGLLPHHGHEQFIFYGQFDNAENIQSRADIDASGYVNQVDKTNLEIDRLFTFKEYIANNQLVDLQVDDLGYYHGIIYGQDDITSGTPVGDEKDPNWHLISFDTSGILLSDIHLTKLRPPSSFNLLRLNDGNYVFTSDNRPYIGLTNPSNLWDGYRGRLICLDGQSGEYQWDYVLPYDRLADIRNYRIYDIIKTQNGDLLVCGEVSDSDQYNYFHTSGFISRIRPDGNLIWNRIFKKPDTILFPVEQFYANSLFRSVKELDDGSIAAVGARFKIDQSGAQCMLWTMKVMENGCLLGEECQEEITLDGQHDKTENNSYWPVGTTWYYDYDSITINKIVHTYIKYEITEKFTVGTDTIFRVATNISGHDLLLRQDKLKMYFLNPTLNDYQLNYDFDARNQYYTQLDDCDGDFLNDTIHVDSVEIYFLPDNAKDTMSFFELVRRQRINYGDEQERVIFGIGNEFGGLPLYNCENGRIGALRCFESDILNLNFQEPWFNAPSCDTIWIEDISGLDQVSQPQFSISPNPVMDRLFITASSSMASVEIMDIKGKPKLSMTSDNTTIDVNLGGLEAGIYFVKVTFMNGTQQVMKFLKT